MNSSSKLHFCSTSGLSNSQIRLIPSNTPARQTPHLHLKPVQAEADGCPEKCLPDPLQKSQEENVILQLGLLTVSQSSINPSHLPKLHQEIAARKRRRRKENHLGSISCSLIRAISKLLVVFISLYPILLNEAILTSAFWLGKLCSYPGSRKRSV